MRGNNTDIYWHFTGSPKDVPWHLIKRRRDILNFGNPESPDKAVSTLKLILASKKLKKGTCIERIVEQLDIKPFCSVTELTIKDLLNHSKYFGKVAIGFSSTTINKNFTPVAYKDYGTLSINGDISIDSNAVFDSEAVIGNESDSALKFLEFFFNNEQNDYGMAKALNHELGSVDNIKMTESSDGDDESLCGEREWRCTGDFYFHNDDVVSIIAPKDYITEIKEHLAKCQFSNTIDIVEFEILE